MLKKIKVWLANKLWLFVNEYSDYSYDKAEYICKQTEYDIVPLTFKKVYLKRDIWGDGDTYFEKRFEAVLKDEIISNFIPYILNNIDITREDIPRADAIEFRAALNILKRK